MEFVVQMLFPLTSLAIISIPDRNGSRYWLCREKIVKYIKTAEKKRESFLKIVYNRFDTSLQRTTYCEDF